MRLLVFVDHILPGIVYGAEREIYPDGQHNRAH